MATESRLPESAPGSHRERLIDAIAKSIDGKLVDLGRGISLCPGAHRG